MSKDLFFEMAVNVSQAADAIDALSAAMQQLSQVEFAPNTIMMNPRDKSRMDQMRNNRNMVNRLKKAA